VNDFNGPLTKYMSEVSPCPCCGGVAVVEVGRQYKVLLQDWHDPDEALYLPATVRCTSCGLRVTRSGNKAEHKGANGAARSAKEEAKKAWNLRS
jgi:hypothetical protein